MTGRACDCSQTPAASTASLRAHRPLLSLMFGSTGSLPHQFGRYVVTGVLAFIVDFGSLYLLTDFGGVYYLTSTAIAFLFGVLTSYCLSRTWVFNRRTMENSAMEFVVFAIIGVVGLGFNIGIIWFVRELIHLHYLIGKAIATLIVLTWNFGARKMLLFSGRQVPNFQSELAPLANSNAERGE